MAKRLAILLAGTLATNPVYANWQYTKWGMTLAEVLALEHGVAATSAEERERETTPEEGSTARGRALATASYEILGPSAKAYFLFDGNRRLDGVLIDLTWPPTAFRPLSPRLPRRTLQEQNPISKIDRRLWAELEARWQARAGQPGGSSAHPAEGLSLVLAVTPKASASTWRCRGGA